MKQHKYLIIRCLAIAFILFAANFIYTKFFFEKDLQIHGDMINLTRGIDSARVIYMGESSNFTFSPNDSDKRKISDMICDFYPDLKIQDITHGALHAYCYYIFLKTIPDNSKLETIIITLNLRSFDANWRYSDLETFLQKQMIMIDPTYPPLFRRFLLGFKGYDNKTVKERERQFLNEWDTAKLIVPFPLEYNTVKKWDNAIASNGYIDVSGNRNEDSTILACHYIKTYAFQIDVNKNPRIKDFDNIVKLAKQKGWHVIFNLMAENTQKANKLVGKELIYLIKQNRDLLVTRYSKMGATVVDNLECVNDSDYIDQNWTTEHYKETGRKTIAKNVAEALKPFYAKNYKSIIENNK